MGNKVPISMGLALVATVGLVGCGATVPSSTARTTLPDVAVVALSPQTAPNWWFPIQSLAGSNELNTTMNTLMYEPLIRISAHDKIDYQHSLLSDITANATGTVYTLTINPKWHWSNGRPVTSADVVFTGDLLLGASSSKAPWEYAGVGFGGLPVLWKSIAADGEYHVIVTLEKPTDPLWFIRNGLSQLWEPVAKSVWDKYPNNMNRELSFISRVSNDPQAPQYQIIDGPFKLSRAVPNEEWAFVPNTHYDGHKATIKKLIYQYESSSAAEFTALKEGTVNVGYLPASMWSAQHELAHDVLTPTYIEGFNYLQPNLSASTPGVGAAFQDRVVRAALEMGVDQKEIIRTFYHSHGVIENGPIPSKPASIYFDRNLPSPYAFNLTGGKKLLLDNGWHMARGVMTKNGVALAFTFDYVSGSVTAQDVAQLMKSDWAKEGISVTLQPEEFSTIEQEASPATPTKWTLVSWGSPGWTYIPDYFPNGSGLFGSTGVFNLGGYDNATMNTLTANIYRNGSRAHIMQRFDAYEAWAVQQIPVIWMPWTPTFTEHSTSIHGTVKWFNPAMDLNQPNHWTITR